MWSAKLANKTTTKTSFNSQRIDGHFIINIVICVLQPQLKCILGREENLTYFPSNQAKMEKNILLTKTRDIINILIYIKIIKNGDVNHKKIGKNILFP